MATVTSKDVTVCVVVKDRVELMARCLDGIAGQTQPPKAIVVVDNHSTDGTLELLHARAATSKVPMSVVSDDGSLGHIRNLAVATATTELVAFTDSDCVPLPDWLEQLLITWNATDDERLGVVQGRTTPDPSAERAPWDATQNLQTFTDRYEASNLLYRRQALTSTAGFDERLGFFGEDTAAGWHVKEAGWSAAFSSAAEVHHAVTHAGFRWHLRRNAHYGNFCGLIKLFPAMRKDLWARYFLRQRSAMTWLAIIGTMLMLLGIIGASVTGDLFLLIPIGPGFALVRPWIYLSLVPNETWRIRIWILARRGALDLVVAGALLIGSLRHRTLVL